ncbi:hypothetical protein CYANOKiyG1_63610 [Okeania sp. KiyG1]|nr:hypothetical protein CYANOKiyG1_63610 [Okeania sp. KiyG1]
MPELKKKIHLRLTQLYLGYLAREHTALSGERKVNNKKTDRTDKTDRPILNKSNRR